MLEQQIQRNILKKLRARGIWAVKTIHTNRNGCPDILACHQGRFLAIEVKRPGGKLSHLQIAQLARIETAGGIAIVATSWDEVLEKLNGEKK